MEEVHLETEVTEIHRRETVMEVPETYLETAMEAPEICRETVTVAPEIPLEMVTKARGHLRGMEDTLVPGILHQETVMEVPEIHHQGTVTEHLHLPGEIMGRLHHAGEAMTADLVPAGRHLFKNVLFRFSFILIM